MKTLGINIDGVIRMFLDKFDMQYRKVFIHNPNIVGMNQDSMTVKELTEDEEQELEKKISEKERELITLPVDSFNLLNHYRFNPQSITMSTFSEMEGIEGLNLEPINYTPQQAYEKFLYEDYPFQIFGQADEYKQAMDSINKLQSIGLNKNLFNVVLFSTHKSKAISSTYFFLSKINCRIKKVQFLENDSDKWEHCDVLVDIMPESFQTKPPGKISIKINHPFNKWDSADYSYQHIKELCNEPVLEKIFINDK